VGAEVAEEVREAVPVVAAEVMHVPAPVVEESEPEPVAAEVQEVPPAEEEPEVRVFDLAAEAEMAAEDEAPQADAGAEAAKEDDGVAAGSADIVPEATDEVADDDGAVEPVAPSPSAPARIVLMPVVADDVPVTPYVVLPQRRAVAVREREREVEEVAETEPRRGGRWKVVLLVAVLVAGAASAFALTGRDRAPTGPFTAEAQDGAISLDAPAGWRLDARGAGVLGIGEAGHDMHVHATAIRRSALADGLSLKRRAEQVHEEFVASLDDVDASRTEAAKVGPHPAIRQVLSADSVTYVHTVVKMSKYFVNVLAWTSAERFDDEKDTLLGVVGTLQSSD
jgi:hypothetical protein